jgi:hypothetical protein
MKITSESQNLSIKKLTNGTFEYFSVCNYNWTNSLSNRVCQELGYSGMVTWNTNANTKDKHYLSLTSDGNITYSIFNNLKLIDGDACDGTVQIICEEYVCGQQNNKKFNETKSSPNLALVFNQDFSPKCSATIVSPKWALASYSCLNGGNSEPSKSHHDREWILFAGDNVFPNKSSQGSDSPAQFSKIKSIHEYPQAKYKKFVYSNDFVLLELASPLKFDDFISSTCLSENLDLSETECVTTGWSVDSANVYHQYKENLMISDAITKECNSTKYFNGHLPDDSICATSENMKNIACNNDEGAPIFCYSNSNQQWILKGVLSYHSNCKKHVVPSIYSGLNSSVISWIKNTIGNDKMFSR